MTNPITTILNFFIWINKEKEKFNKQAHLNHTITIKCLEILEDPSIPFSEKERLIAALELTRP